jgi:hypothetical protein
MGEWIKDVENISVEPISLAERGTQEPSVNEGDGDEEGSEMALFEGFLRGGCGYRCWEVWEWSPRALMTILVGGWWREKSKSAYRLLDVAKKLPGWEFWMIYRSDGSRND